MIRLLGGALIMAACAGAGQRGAMRLKEQRQRYCGWQQGLLTLSREIEYSLNPLAQALRAAAAAAGPAAEMFNLSSRLVAEGDGLSGGEAWAMALRQARLSPQEREILTPLCSGLGAGDAVGQLRQLEAAIARLRDAERLAAEKEQQYAKLWRSMGWAAGAVLILLLV